MVLPIISVEPYQFPYVSVDNTQEVFNLALVSNCVVLLSLPSVPKKAKTSLLYGFLPHSYFLFVIELKQINNQQDLYLLNTIGSIAKSLALIVIHQ